MKSQIHLPSIKFPSLCGLCALAGAAALLGGIARAGENFSGVIKGAALTFVADQEAAGFVYRDSTGLAVDPYQLCANHGLNYVRLFVATGDQTKINTQLGLATRAKAAGLKIELDLGNPLDLADTTSQLTKDWNLATGNGANFNSIGANQQNLRDDVMYWIRGGTSPSGIVFPGILNQFLANGTPADMAEIGNEIQDSYWGVPSGATNHALYYQLVYEALTAMRKWDFTNSMSVPTGSVVHYASIDLTSMTNLKNCKSNYSQLQFNRTVNNVTISNIDLDAFGFSIHSWFDSLASVASKIKTGSSYDMKNPYNGKQIWLFGQEIAYAYTRAEQFFAGNVNSPPSDPTCAHLNCPETLLDCTCTIFPACPSNPSGCYDNRGTHNRDNTLDCSTYCQDNARGAHDYLMALMTNITQGHIGVGGFDWAADDVTGWGSTPVEYNLALWRSDNGQLVQDSSGTTVINAFNHTWTH